MRSCSGNLQGQIGNLESFSQEMLLFGRRGILKFGGKSEIRREIAGGYSHVKEYGDVPTK